MRGERRKRNEAEFELSKAQKQLQFRTTLIANEKDSVIRVKQSELDRANLNFGYLRQEL